MRFIKFISLFCICLFMPSCFPEIDLTGHKVDAAQVKLMIPGVQIPKNAANIWYWEKNFMDRGQGVMFDTTIADAHALAIAILHHDVSTSVTPRFGKLDIPGWEDRNLPGAEGADELVNSTFLKLEIAPIRTGQARVWLDLSEI